MGPAKISWEPVRKEETKRIRHMGWVLFALLLVVLARAFQVQVIKIRNEEVRPPRYTIHTVLPAKRGLITDRNMNILAMDVPCFSAAIDPSVVENPGRAASHIADVLGGDPSDYQTLIANHKNDKFVWLKRDLTKSEKDDLQTLDIMGVILVPERKRAHPCPSLAGAVLGWTDASHQGITGMEKSMDAVLRGEDGWEILQKDGKNRNFSSPDCPTMPPKNGQNVALTLDQIGQAIVEEELENGVLAYRAKSGTAVLMDPYSGEIFSMASVYDRPSAFKDTVTGYTLQNRAVQAEFEPGSTLKVVTAAAALEEGIFTPTAIIHCENGAYRLSGQVIHDHEKRYDYLTFSQVIEYSSNIGIAKIAKKLGRKTLYQYMQNFGFGTCSGIELPGEAPGTLWPVYKWNEFTTATISFGQGISVSTLQLACMMSVIANGGYLIKPRILRSVTDEEGHVIRSFDKEKIRRVLSDRTVLQMRQILERTVKQGNAREAGVNGVRVAGKTGTAQKSLNGFVGYVPGTYTSSFAGFWPVGDPQFVLVVVLEEPKGLYYASQSCAPIFSNIVKRMIGLPSSPISPREKNETKEQENKFVFSDYPMASEAKKTNTEPAPAVQDDPSLVPRVTGLSMRDALKKLADCGLEAKVEGNGAVREQFPKAGEKITSNRVCRLICR